MHDPPRLMIVRPDDWAEQPRFCPFVEEGPGLFGDGGFPAGAFHIRPIRVPHAPGVPNFAAVIHCGEGPARRS